MLKFSKNKKHTFECRVEIEGADYSRTRPRLILSPLGDNKSIFFEGKIENETCKVIIPEGLDIARTGKVVLEILVDNTLFTPYQSEYEMTVESVKVDEIKVNKKEGTVKIIEAKVEEQKPKVIIKPILKHKFLKEEISIKDKKQVESFVKSYQRLPKKDKKFLTEHLKKNFKPKKSTLNWASNIFKNVNGTISKVCMYAIDSGKK